MSSEPTNPAALEWTDGDLFFDQHPPSLLSSLVQKHQTLENRRGLLRHVSLRVPEGTSVVVIGPSGQGKTSLLKVLAGLVPPTAGVLRIRGRDWSTLQTDQRREELRHIGMLFQKNALFDSRTSGENIAFPLREAQPQATLAEIQEQVEFFLTAVGLQGSQNRLPSEMSGGMQKRLGIARALALRPSLVFYDDPTAGLDPLTSRKITDLILEQKKRQRATIVTVTNDMNRAQQLASAEQDQIWFVKAGQVLVTGPARTVASSSHAELRDFWEGRVT